MLITALTDFVREFVLSFFSTSFRQQRVLSQVKTECKKFRREMSGFERPRERSSNKDVGEKYDVRCCEGKFYRYYKCIKYFAELVSFSRNWKRYARAFAKVHCMCMTQLENNLAF